MSTLFPISRILRLDYDQYLYCSIKNTLKILINNNNQIKPFENNIILHYRRNDTELWMEMKEILEKIDNFELRIRLATEIGKYFTAKSKSQKLYLEPKRCKIDVLEWIHLKIKTEILQITSNSNNNSDIQNDSTHLNYMDLKKHYQDALLVWRISKVDYILHMYNLILPENENLIIDPKKLLFYLFNQGINTKSLQNLGNPNLYRIFKHISLIFSRISREKIFEKLLEDWISEKSYINDSIIKTSNLLFSMISRCRYSSLEVFEISNEVSLILNHLKDYDSLNLSTQSIHSKFPTKNVEISTLCLSVISLYLEIQNVDKLLGIEILDRNKVTEDYFGARLLSHNDPKSHTSAINKSMIKYTLNKENFNINDFINFLFKIDLSNIGITDIIWILKNAKIIIGNKDLKIETTQRFWKYIIDGFLVSNKFKQEDYLYFLCNCPISMKDLEIKNISQKSKLCLILLFFKYLMDPNPDDLKRLNSDFGRNPENACDIIDKIMKKIYENNIFKNIFNIC